MYQLGFDPVFEIAAEHGDGVGDLLDAIVRELPRIGIIVGTEARLRSRSRSSGGRMQASLRWSIGCFVRSG